ncbi:MAG: porin [Luteolibacter sp.]
MKAIWKTAAALWMGMGVLGVASAEATGLLVGKLAEGSEYDRLWSIPMLYQNENNPYIEELAIQGQIQTQYAYGSDDTGEFSSGDLADSTTWGDVDVRRLRGGVKARLFKNLKLQTLFDIYPDISPRFYNRMVEAYLSYSFNSTFNLSVGKTELRFSHEQEISAREILPFERSLLEGTLYGGQLTGIWLSGKGIAGGFFYEAGVYGNDRQDEFTDMKGGAMILTKIGYDYAKKAHMDKAQVALHYLHNTDPGYVENPGDLVSPSFSNSFALSNDMTLDKFSLATEAYWGEGANGRSNVYGLTVTPAYYLMEKLQLVTMFQFAQSSDPNGFGLPSRYEALSPGAGDKKGDAYFSAYSGLNYYIYGHKLKLMAGVKYANMSGGSGGGDFDGFTGLLGVRAYF